MDHCPACQYFAKTLEWQCLYKEQAPICEDPRAVKAVQQFRTRMKDIEKRIAAKGNPSP